MQLAVLHLMDLVECFFLVLCGCFVVYDYLLTNVNIEHLLLKVSSSFGYIFRQSTHAIKEFWVQCLKCRVTLFNLWDCSHHGTYLPNFLLSAARSLFQQVKLLFYLSFGLNYYILIHSYGMINADDLCTSKIF